MRDDVTIMSFPTDVNASALLGALQLGVFGSVQPIGSRCLSAPFQRGENHWSSLDLSDRLGQTPPQPSWYWFRYGSFTIFSPSEYLFYCCWKTTVIFQATGGWGRFGTPAAPVVARRLPRQVVPEQAVLVVCSQGPHTEQMLRRWSPGLVTTDGKRDVHQLWTRRGMPTECKPS